MDEFLVAGARELGVELDSAQTEKFSVYWELLSSANEHMNLTAITDREEAYRRHFLDSLALFLAADFTEKSVADVGTGAGFPGIPIKIACDSSRVALLESQSKRVAFLTNVCQAINLDAQIILGRAEEVAREPDFRESFDFAVSRAVARLDILAELCMPFIKKGGRFLAMKAGESQVEITQATSAIKTLGGVMLPPICYTTAQSDILRKIVVIEKIAETPAKYPRRFSRIQKSPIS